MSKKQSSRTKMAALLMSTALIAAACGSDTDSSVDAAAADTAAPLAEVEEAMEEDAMEEEAMEEEAMEEEAMEDSDGATNPLELTFAGLEPLGDDFVYEGWVVVDDAPVSTGRFTVDAEGTQLFHSDLLFHSESLIDDASDAAAFILTIEPAVGDGPAPADAHVLAGDLVDGVAELTVGHPAALGNDFSEAGGQFVLATPTTTVEDDELSGIWFIDIVDGAATQGVDLPELPAGWVYEGWAVIDGQPVSTGTFTDPAAADDFNGFSGTDTTGPNFPGEDFIQNAPEGLEFPLDLTGSTVVISIEPEDDDSPAPFAFKPLAAEIAAGTADHVDIELGAGPGFPTGTAALR